MEVSSAVIRSHVSAFVTVLDADHQPPSPARASLLKALRGAPSGDGFDAWLLVPPLTLALVVAVACGCVSLGVPLQPLISGFWMAVPLVILAILWIRGGVTITRASIAFALVAAGTIWAVLADMKGHLLFSEVISYHPDAWGYAAMADFFKHYQRGQDPVGIPMVDMFGSTLQNTRFGSAAILAFLNDAPGLGGLPAVHRGFYVLCLAVHFCSFCYCARGLSRSWAVAVGAAVLGTAAGWIAHVITLGNYDNLLFVSLSPAWLGMLIRFEQGRLQPAVFIPGSGILLAALFEAYPEGCALLSLLILPLGIQLLTRAFKRPAYAWCIVAAAGVTLLLVLPYLPTFISFLRSQIATGKSTAGVLRPGSNNFLGLLDSHWFPAIFALGEEFSHSSFRWFNCLLPAFLCVCTAGGARIIGKELRWFPWTVIPLAGLAIWQGVVWRYDYGFYKVILCAAWWIYPAIAVGYWSLARRVTTHAWGLALLTTAFGAAIATEKWEDQPSSVWRSTYSLAPLRSLNHIDDVIGHDPVLLEIDNDFEFLWATIFLRNHRIAATTLRSYYGLFESRRNLFPKLKDCRYALVSRRQPGAVWQNQRFSLVPNRGAFLSGIINPPATEPLDLRAFFWLSGQQTMLTVMATQPGSYELRAKRWALGPPIPGDNTKRQVRVIDSAGTREIVLTVAADGSAPPPVIPVQLKTGENRIALRGLDRLSAAVTPGGDARELLLGIEGLSVSECLVEAPEAAASP